MNDSFRLGIFWEVIVTTIVFLVIFLFIKGIGFGAIFMSAYIAICCAVFYILCTPGLLTHLKISFMKSWSSVAFISLLPLLYYLFIILFRLFFYDGYREYISFLSPAESVASTLIPAMTITEEALVKNGLYDRVEEARHNFSFAVFCNFLSFYWVLSYFPRWIESEIDFIKEHGISQSDTLEFSWVSKLGVILICVVAMYTYFMNWATDSSCSVKCYGIDNSDLGFLFLYYLGSILGCTLGGSYKVIYISRFMKQQNGKLYSE